ncbi:MAG TPA: heavy metal translocating P-type ATPase metal-binding domain-containing protein, partial [Chitinophagaceae bacterium]|nr:heavy metal translocating P-type ATPase metal-binding domain-containing protein [Chitinophagaceae bacterium]
MPVTTAVPPVTKCYHCGEPCAATAIVFAEQAFCCEGCKMVYSILQQGDLCAYYTLNSNPGLPQKTRVRNDKFAFLDDAAIQQKIIRFSNAEQVHVIFYLPQIHCSSCLYLLEKLHRLEEGIVAVKVNFTAKEVSLVYHPAKTTLRKVAELLAHIGYEPYISLQDLHSRRPVTGNNAVYRVGVAGFCFGNIMLLSFPEYLGIDASETLLRTSFRWLSFLLSLPVVLYAAYPFFAATVKSIRQRFLTIDAPIALAILITFVRSVWEVFSGTGSGYFDSMAGIVFFMLAGRMLQDRTYRQLSFNRNYASYFPVAVAVLQEG